MRPGSKVGPAMAGQTGPVPPGLLVRMYMYLHLCKTEVQKVDSDHLSGFVPLL